MPQTLRQIKTRIKTVENVRKVTWAMEMVSVSKMRSLQAALAAARVYHAKIEKMTAGLIASTRGARHPLLRERPGNKRRVLFAVTSDTGLCGGYNNAVISKAEDFIKDTGAGNVAVIVVGKKGMNHFARRGIEIAGSYADMYGRYSELRAREITARLMEEFLRRGVGSVHAVYASFVSAVRYSTLADKLLCVSPPPGKETEYITEPSSEEILARLLPAYVESKVRLVMLQAFASEHSARITAMSEATNNAEDLMDGLLLARNKIRQANITREIIEVISSSDAMKG